MTDLLLIFIGLLLALPHLLDGVAMKVAGIFIAVVLLLCLIYVLGGVAGWVPHIAR